MRTTTPRLTVACLALAGAGLAAAQQQDAGPSFRVSDDQRFGGGETWRTRTELETTRAPIGRQGEDEVTTIVWGESSDVLERPHGFALRSTLRSWRLRATGPNTETTIEYDDEDLRTIRVGEREVDFARTWTYEFDPSWRLLDVSGQRRTFKQLYARAMRDMGGEGDRCGGLRSWFMRRARPFVVDRWSEGVEEALVRMNAEGLAPVRVVMERLRGGDELGADFEARLAPAGDLPAGTIHLVGRGERGAEFRVTFDVQGTDKPVPEYAFAIDDAGRLAWLDALGSDVVEQDGRELRVTTRFSYALEEVTRQAPPQEQPQRGPRGVDASDEAPQGEGEQEGQQPRRPF